MHEQLPFGQWLRQRRKTLDLTQVQLADRLGCSPDMIRKIELGARKPSRQMAMLLASLLKVPAEEREAFISSARGIDAETKPDERAIKQRPPTNIPAPITHLIGREEVIADIRARLVSGNVRLLTLTGPPGIGKTRLSLEVGIELLDYFEDGVFFVSLAPIADSTLVLNTVTRTLDLPDQGDQPLLETLARRLRDRQMLLLLDNFEQVIDAGPAVSYLLERCPSLIVLVTSRAALHVRGEHQFPVPPLELPDLEKRPGADMLAYNPAMALFVERAQNVQPNFALIDDNAESVAAICVHLDGLPLAIELAAARIRSLSPQEIEARLGSRLMLLTGGSRDLPARQQTLRSAIDWSYALLSKGEQTLFARLGVFVGGCTFPAAEAVCNARGDLPFVLLDGLESLLDKSLLKREAVVGGESRFTMLEVVREFAQERLEESREADEIQQLHAEYYLALAEAADLQLRGPDQATWLERLDREQNNMRAIFNWADKGRDVEFGLRLAGALGWFWELRGYFAEARELVASVLSQEGAGKRTLARAKALNAAGRLAEWNVGVAQPLLEESLAIAQGVGDKQLMEVVLHNLGNVALYRGDYAAADRLLGDSLTLARERGETWSIAWALMGLGHVALGEDDYPRARTFFEESLTIRKQMDDRWGIARSLNELGDVTRLQGDYAAARSYYEKSLAIHRELGHKGFMEVVLFNLAHVAHAEGNYRRARRLYTDSLTLFREQGKRTGIGVCLTGIAAVDYAQGHLERSSRLFGAAEALFDATGYEMDPLDRADVEVPMATVRGTKSLRAAWAEGRAMVVSSPNVEQAITYALESQA